MRILLINAGAKDHGATQEILQTMLEEIPDGSGAKLVCLGTLEIGFCRGCKACYETCECVQTDDVKPLLDEMEAADILVIAAPSYWADVPGQFKTFIDRCTPYSNTSLNPNHWRLKSGKKCYAIALRTGTNPSECEHIIETIRHWCGHMGIEMADSVYFCGINDERDILPHRQNIREKAQAWFAEVETAAAGKS